jgi:hypothetical protein
MNIYNTITVFFYLFLFLLETDGLKELCKILPQNRWVSQIMSGCIHYISKCNIMLLSSLIYTYVELKNHKKL